MYMFSAVRGRAKKTCTDWRLQNCVFFPLTQKCDVISCLPGDEFDLRSEEFIPNSFCVEGEILNNPQDGVWARDVYFTSGDVIQKRL